MLVLASVKPGRPGRFKDTGLSCAVTRRSRKMRKIAAIVSSLVILSGCSSLAPKTADDASQQPANESELMNSQQVVVPAADDDSAEALGSDTDSQASEQDENETLDSNIDPSVKDEVQKARAKLDNGDSSDVETTPAAPQDLWAHLRSTFKLDLDRDNPRIEAQVKWYASHPGYLNRTVQRASRYLYYITDQLQKRNMPGELALLPVVESAFDPFAYSHGRASGLWQFIPSTGRIYGLDQDWWYDGRRDVVQSTDAALRYLQALSNRFDGKWLLALASYNSGAGTVINAVKHNERRHKPTDFWSLHLPKETSAYVPKLLAIAKIVQDPAKYGVTLKSLPDTPYFKIVETHGQIDLAQAAKLAGVDVEEIYLLNPGCNRWATDPKGPGRLLVPAKDADTFETALAELPKNKRVTWHNYRVKNGDSLIVIAHQFRTTPSVIRQINGLHTNMIRVGQHLLIPVASHDGKYYALSAAARLKATQERYASSGRTRVNYRVRHGDTLWDIARAHNVSVRKLAKWNGMAPTDPLMPGHKLVILKADTRLAMASTSPSRQEMIRKIGYRVHRGDSLSRIANRFNVDVADIVDWNSINPDNYLRPGESLVLYVDIRNSP